MGLLDEAIREHLDLKRQQGADPDEIARTEREALEPVVPDEPATWGAAASPLIPLEMSEEPAAEEIPAEPVFASEELPPIQDAVDFSSVGQETAEIDMREVFGEDLHDPAEAYAALEDVSAPVRASGRITGSAEAQNELDWEVAGRMTAPAHDIPGQERLSFE